MLAWALILTSVDSLPTEISYRFCLLKVTNFHQTVKMVGDMMWMMNWLNHNHLERRRKFLNLYGLVEKSYQDFQLFHADFVARTVDSLKFLYSLSGNFFQRFDRPLWRMHTWRIGYYRIRMLHRNSDNMSTWRHTRWAKCHSLAMVEGFPL